MHSLLKRQLQKSTGTKGAVDYGQLLRLVDEAYARHDGIIALQQELKEERDRLQKASRSKSDFLANMSHEIRTPMNSIMGMINLLLETSLDPQQQMWARIVRNSSESLLHIIDDILDISKIEAARLELEHIPFNLRDIIEQVVDTFLLKAQEKHIEIRVLYDPRAPRSFIGDPGRIRQILINLIGNAIKFTRNGSIYLSIKADTADADKMELFFELEDTGVGIPPDKLEYIFEKFSQAEESTTRKFGGTGLGLAICRSLVQMMGGEINVRSAPGQGSVFSFNIRLTVDSGGANRQRAPEPAQGQDENYADLSVLVAEDMPANQIYLQILLERYKCSVDLAGDGVEALQKIREKAYDIVFMDCQMPEMDGFEATRRIRAQKLARRPTIIALTANAMQGDRERCLQAGMDDYLNKPVKAEKILEVLRQFASRSHQP